MARLSQSVIEVAFVVDTTGSMRDDIRAVKNSLFDIVEQITARTENLAIRFALVSYRDHPPEDRTYVTKVFDFTDDVSAIHNEISRLKPSKGGDPPEAVADGLHDARTKLSWSANAYKVLLLVGDAPPHGRKYNNFKDDRWPNGCPAGFDPIDEIQMFRKEFGSTAFVFVLGCNLVVEDSFRHIAEAVEDGKYFSLLNADELPTAIIRILEEVGNLIESDRKVLSFYQLHDGTFDLREAASQLGLTVRDLKTSLSRLLELGYILKWPRGRPLTSAQLGLNAELGTVPDAIVAGKAFKYKLRIKNPSQSIVIVRIVASLITETDVSEITNEQHEIGPRSDETLELSLILMTFEKGKATIRVEVFYGSRSIASKVYKTRIY